MSCREQKNLKVYELPRNFGLGGAGLTPEQGQKLKNITVTHPINLDNLGNTTPHTSAFVVANWVSGVLTINASQHGKGSKPIIRVYDKNGVVVEDMDILRDPNGNFTITNPNGNGFDGEATIVGGNGFNYVFKTSNFVNATLTVLSNQHKKGTNPNADVYDSSGNKLNIDIQRSEIGDITVTPAFGNGFDGEITII